MLKLSVGGLNKYYLCEKLNRWLAMVAFRQSIDGNIVEPAHFDCTEFLRNEYINIGG